MNKGVGLSTGIAIGIALGHDGAWFTGPAWVSFVIGWALILSGVVSRVQRSAVAPDD